MRKFILYCTLGCLLMFGCSNDEDLIDKESYVSLFLRMQHSWDGESITLSDLNTIKYENANGEKMSVERLRYLISDVTLEKEDGTFIALEDYYLIDVSKEETMVFEISDSIPPDTYKNISFTFGFDNEDNLSGVYPDLNAALWNVPEMLGGGYHFMQLEGKFLDESQEEIGYQYHAIKAVDISGDEPVFQDTFFTVDLGSVTIEGEEELQVSMDVSEWFNNPVQWDLNELHSMMMPNFDAQVMMFHNGQNVFALKGD
ncbi:MbnP family protein [Euzebyella saccharophila]|uniref:MbnP family protein n=1 Tax=Euzebyella saccharophila TaxID=679664 RepID=A0ABV8JMW7_9FLAO|nr:MbnP family protein [Euzebyella saccharophila]